MPIKGINIEFRNLTKGHHFDMVQGAIVDGGSISKLSTHDWKNFSEGLLVHIIERRIHGITYEVELRYDVKGGKFIAECDYY